MASRGDVEYHGTHLVWSLPSRLFALPMKRLCLFAVLASLLVSPWAIADDEAPIRVLFLGDDGPHRPAERFAQLEPVLAGRGIELTYTDRVADLNPETLAGYDALAVRPSRRRGSGRHRRQ
jgi:hypothetical protein